MPPVLYFYGAGNVSALERASYDKDVRVVFTKKAYLCREANDQWRKIWCEFKAEHQFGVPVLLTMDNHSSQTRKQWRKEMRAHDTEILHTEPGGTHVCQLIDRHIGHMHKQLFEEVQMEYLLDSWDGFRHLSARDRRITLPSGSVRFGDDIWHARGNSMRTVWHAQDWAFASMGVTTIKSQWKLRLCFRSSRTSCGPDWKKASSQRGETMAQMWTHPIQ